MAQGKVEICGVNTAKLPILNEKEKEDLFVRIKAGDEAATAIVEEVSAYLGNALAMFACVVDPEVIVIGGGVSKAGEILVDGVKKYYRRDAFISCKETPIVLAELGNDAGIYGAAKLALG